MDKILFIATIVGASTLLLWLLIYFGWLAIAARRRQEVKCHDRYINEYYLKRGIRPSPTVSRIRNATALRYNDMLLTSSFRHLTRYKPLKIETYENVGIRPSEPAPKLNETPRSC